ncbi:MAG: hypothetical protein MHM6MM_007952, partial [Cercozoa sp. M6MM]
GTVAERFGYAVQFGHAGACANAARETASHKNRALRESGAHVPESYDGLPELIAQQWQKLVENGVTPRPDFAPPRLPMNFAWARRLGLVRKPAAFVSAISDERGEELRYANVKISEVVESQMGIGGVIGLLWFRRRLPEFAGRFIDLVLQLTADHGPAVSGAHNTIVAARAGKDLVSSLASGMLTIGPRFGGALDRAAAMFMDAYDRGLSAIEFVEECAKRKVLISGIGHKVKSLENPDMRVTLVLDFVQKYFPAHARGKVKDGALNALFVVGRSIGLVGHFLDQTRLRQGLYRHPTDDIDYITEENF